MMAAAVSWPMAKVGWEIGNITLADSQANRKWRRLYYIIEFVLRRESMAFKLKVKTG
jgi:hypothetical protein